MKLESLVKHKKDEKCKGTEVEGTKDVKVTDPKEPASKKAPKKLEKLVDKKKDPKDKGTEVEKTKDVKVDDIAKLPASKKDSKIKEVKDAKHWKNKVKAIAKHKRPGVGTKGDEA
jgi:hypothetical protein